MLYCMNRDKFQRLVIGIAFKRRKMYEEFLNSVPLLKQSMNDYERSQVADALVSKTYSPGECIFKQGDQANGMYFIESGRVNIIGEESTSTAATATDGNEKGILISELQVGDYFGEIALVNKLPRSASAYAATESECGETCKVAFLELNAFERLMGPCIELLKSKIGSYKNL
jgi:cAMP-dependent protein kinase regulator